jgi:hypothetical protein
MILPRAVLFAFLCVAMSATSAAAECAWVLWAQGQDGRIGLTGQAYETKFACDQAQEMMSKKLKDDEDNIYYLGASRTPGSRIVSIYCLPDTVDPRGVKGTGR